MEYRLLGRTGVSVSPLCLGTMMFGPWGNDDRADAIRVIHRALDAGINFVDTADVYSGGVSEEIVGEALQGRRDDVVLATKFFMPMGDRPNHSGGSRKWIMQEAENSMRRLKTDYIDLYQVHRPSATTDDILLVKPPPTEPSPFQPGLDVRVGAHDPPNEPRPVIFDHREDRPLVDSEVIAVEPRDARSDRPGLRR